MHWTLAALCLLVPWAALAGRWRPASLVLAGAWMAGQAWWLATGDQVPLRLYLITDAICIAALLRWHGSALDWLILATFPFVAWAYAAQAGAQQWWTLWVLTSLQLALAGPWTQAQRALSSFSHGPRRAGILP